MTDKDFDPQNILVIHFGQMGDVILAMPALRAIRERFPRARLTAMVGKSCASIVRLAGVFDEEIVVDRVELRDGNKIRSLKTIRLIVKDVRARRFDFIIDLHSLSETNLLGFVSGAKARLFANRETRSLDFFGKFPEKPPREDRTKHITDRYLEVLKPLGIEAAARFVEIQPKDDDLDFVRRLIGENTKPVGFFPGAGHPSRRWSLENFASLAVRIRERDDSTPLVVFLGPEETEMRDDVLRLFPSETFVLDKLSIPQLLAAASLLRVLVSNDTGVVHIGAIAGASLVLVMDERAPLTYLPLTEEITVVNSGPIDDIGVDEVFGATLKFL